MRLVKYLALFLVTVLLLITAGSYIAIQIIGEDDVKAFISKRAYEQTGRDLIIKGSIAPSISLLPSLSLSDISFSNPDWATHKELITAKEVTVTLNILPLLERKIEIREIGLVGAVIHLEDSSKGKSWEFRPSAHASTSTDIVKNDSVSSSSNKMALSIAQIQIEDTQLNYHKSNKTEALHIHSLSLHDLTEDLSVGSLDLNALYKQATIALVGKSIGENLNLQGDISSDGVAVNVDGNLAISDMTFDLKTDIKADSVTALGAMIDQPISDNNNLSLSADVGGRLELTRLTNINLHYGDHHVQGTLDLNTANKKPYIKAILLVPSLVIPETNSNAASDTPNGEAPIASEQKKPSALPLEFLQLANADIDLQIEQLATDQVTLNKVQLKGINKNGILNLERFAAHMGEGKIFGSGTLDSTVNPVNVSLDVNSQNVVLEPWLKKADITNIKDGYVQGHAKLNASGDQLDSLLKTSKGTINLYVEKARFEVPQNAVEAIEFFKLLGEKEIVDVSCFAGKFDLNDGIARSKVLALKTPAAVVSGDGSINLPAETLSLAFRVNQSRMGLVDLVPPLRVAGPYSNLKVILDPRGTILNVGKLFLGASSGVGLAAVLGEKVTDKLGITTDNNPCLASIAEAQEQDAKNRSAKETYKQGEDAVRAKRDELKKDFKEKKETIKQDFKEKKEDVKKTIKGFEDSFRNLRDAFKKPKEEPAPAPAPAQ